MILAESLPFLLLSNRSIRRRLSARFSFEDRLEKKKETFVFVRVCKNERGEYWKRV